MVDARFEDGDEGPLLLVAREGEDLTVLSALVQDAVLPASEMRFDRRRQRFDLLVNRFRWEDSSAAAKAGRAFERVRALLSVENVRHVRSQGITPGDADQVLALLALEWLAGEDGTGKLRLLLAGDGAIELEVEALEVQLRDVTKPYIAPSRKQPDHGV